MTPERLSNLKEIESYYKRKCARLGIGTRERGSWRIAYMAWLREDVT